MRLARHIGCYPLPPPKSHFHLSVSRHQSEYGESDLSRRALSLNRVLAHACRLPITDEDKANEKYIPGVSCPACFDKVTDDKKARFAEREKQIQLANQRGEAHIGGAVAERIEINKARKQAARVRQQLNNKKASS